MLTAVESRGARTSQKTGPGAGCFDQRNFAAHQPRHPRQAPHKFLRSRVSCPLSRSGRLCRLVNIHQEWPGSGPTRPPAPSAKSRRQSTCARLFPSGRREARVDPIAGASETTLRADPRTDHDRHRSQVEGKMTGGSRGSGTVFGCNEARRSKIFSASNCAGLRGDDRLR